MSSFKESMNELNARLDLTTKLLRAAKQAAKMEKKGQVVNSKTDPIYRLTTCKWYFSNGVLRNSVSGATMTIAEIKADIRGIKDRKGNLAHHKTKKKIVRRRRPGR
jgi:hypothetical protein